MGIQEDSGLCAVVRNVFVAAALLLAGCGGGGGGADPFVAPPPVGSNGDWERGVFQPSGNFKASCAAPRTGIDPATGQRYPDRAGSLIDELNFLRSFSDETYLWYSEIIDRDPSFYTDPLFYFDLLKTNRTDANGDPIDRFHFTYDSEEWYQLAQTGVSAGYGAVWSLRSTVPPRDVVIAYVEAGSPAALAQLERGTRILSVDGVDIDTNTQGGIDTLNAGLFPSQTGVLHSFVVQDRQGATRSVSMRSATVSIDPVPVTSVFTLPDQRRVGYMLFNDHIATAELALIEAVE
ncbi:MAG: peptidase, partial [Pseudomonadota bacterium]